LAHFPRIFNDLYEDKIIDRIFQTEESIITREEFVNSIGGNIDEEPKAAFIFNKIAGTCMAASGIRAYASQIGQITSSGGT